MAIAYSEAIWIASLGLLVNLVSAWLLGGDHHHDHHHTHDNGHHHAHADNNLRSAYFHVLAAALTSVLAITALLAGRYLGWVWMDAAMGFVGAVVIARSSWGLMQNTAAVLADSTVTGYLEQEIRDAIEDGDAQIANLHGSIGRAHD